MPDTPPTDSARSILENVNAPELSSLPVDLGNALSESCKLIHVVGCIHRTASDLELLNRLLQREIYAQGVNFLPELIKETEAAVGPVLEEIRDAAEPVVRFGTLSGLSAYDVVLEIARDTVRLAKHAETSKFPFSKMIKKPPEREEWKSFMVQLGKEARDAGRARPRRSAVSQEKLLEEISAQLENRGNQENSSDNKGASKNENTKSETQTENESHPDGPEHPNLLWVNGEKHEITLMSWRLINHMWVKDKVEESEITQAVWSGKKVTDSTLRSTINRANNEMAKALINRKLYTKAGYVCWKEGS